MKARITTAWASHPDLAESREPFVIAAYNSHITDMGHPRSFMSEIEHFVSTGHKVKVMVIEIDAVDIDRMFSPPPPVVAGTTSRKDVLLPTGQSAEVVGWVGGNDVLVRLTDSTIYGESYFVRDRGDLVSVIPPVPSGSQ